MSNNQIFIVLNGDCQSILNAKSSKIILAKEKIDNLNQDHTLLQTNFDKVEDFIKAEVIIRNQFSKIDELIIINKDVNLNMLSYQYDYNNIRQNYQILINVIHFVNLLIPLFNNKFCFVLSLEKDNHYKVHLNNFKISLINYLNSLKKDLSKSNNIVLKELV